MVMVGLSWVPLQLFQVGIESYAKHLVDSVPPGPHTYKRMGMMTGCAMRRSAIMTPYTGP